MFLFNENFSGNSKYSYQDNTRRNYFYKPNIKYLEKIKINMSVWNNWIIVNKKELVISNFHLSGANLDRFLLENSDFSKLFLNGISYKYSKLINTNFHLAKIWSSSFLYADLRNSNFSGADINYTNFSYANLTGIKLNARYIGDCYFVRANLENSDFSNIQLWKQSVREPLPPVRPKFNGANLKNSNFSNIAISYYSTKTDFTACNLENVNFRNSMLASANFTSAYLKGADFTNTNLDDAIIEKKWENYLAKFKKTIKNWETIKWIENRSNYNPTFNHSLVVAAKNGNVEECNRLLKSGADPDAAIDGVPALTWACYKGHIKAAELLLNNNADINILDKDIDTPLIAAVFANKPEIVKLLLSRSNVKINFKNFSRKTALDIALEKGHTEIIQLLKAKNAQDTGKWRLNQLLLTACDNGNLEAIKSALEKGADVNARDVYGRTALMIVFYWKNIHAADYLLSKGADLQAKDFYGENALMEAAREGNIDIVRYLVEKGIRIDLTAKRNNTALQLAAEENHLDVVKNLAPKVNNKADFVEAMTRASQRGHIRIIQYILSLNINIDIRNRLGNTALMEAARFGNIGLVRFLLSRGADINAINKGTFSGISKYTPLMYAVVNGKLDMVKFLISKGANIHAKDAYGNSVHTLAIASNQKKIAEYLKSIGARLH